MDIKRFFESQISRHLDATRRTSSGIARSQDRDRLHFYQSLLREAKAERLDLPAFEDNLSRWAGGKKHGLDLDLQSVDEQLFRGEVLSGYRAYQSQSGVHKRDLVTADTSAEPLSRKAIASIAVVPLMLILGAGIAGGAALANAGPFEDDDDEDAQVSEADASAGPGQGEAEVVVPPADVEDEETDPIDSDSPIQRLIVESADIDNSSILTLGLQDDDSTFEVPTNATQVAWYEFSGLPGEESRPTVPILAAHVDYRGQDGVFKTLVDASPGTFMYLVMADDTVFKYRIVSNRDIAKTVLTWEDLGCDPEQCFTQDAVTLITCGGNFNSRTRSYTDNVVVRAQLVEVLSLGELPA